METLSGWLQQNREDFLSVQDGLEQVERRNARYPTGLPSLPTVNGETPAQSPADPSAPTITSLQRSLDAAKNRIEAYEKANDEHNRLQAQYEDTLTEATERIRNYVFQQNDYIASIHKHYTHLLQESRGETVQAQQIHQDWQRGLSKLNDELRRAVQSREEEKLPYTRKVAALKEENRVLRGLAGWKPAEDDSSDDEDELEMAVTAESRGRVAKERERTGPNATDEHIGGRAVESAPVQMPHSEVVNENWNSTSYWHNETTGDAFPASSHD
ncbi:hypothetical protein Q7P37_004221 [Cladosporium fusiforme]